MRYLSIKTIPEDVYRYSTTCMSCSDQLIAMPSRNKSINFYNIYNLKLSHKYFSGVKRIWHLKFSPNGNFIAIEGFSIIKILHLNLPFYKLFGVYICID